MADFAFLDAPPARPRRAARTAAEWAREAAALERAQLLPRAEAAISRAVALEPRDPAFLGYRGALRTGLKRYAEARADLKRALARDPDDPRLLRWLADADFIDFRLEDAARGLEAFSGRRWASQAQFRRGVILSLLGRTDEAAALAAEFRRRPERAAPAWGDLLDATLAFRAGRLEEAEALARAARRADPPIDEPEKAAALHRLFAVKRHDSRRRRRPDMRPTKAKDAPPTLLLMGIGMDPPRNLTLGVIEALETCDTVFLNISGDSLLELVSLFCPKVEPINYGSEADALRCARRIARACAPGKTVGYVTVGHVMVFGALTHELMKWAGREGARCVAYPGVSLMDKMLAAMGLVLGHAFDGFQVHDAANLLVRGRVLDTGVPTGIYFSIPSSGPAKFGRAVAERLLDWYPPEHPCWLFSPESWVSGPEKIAVGDLRRRAPGLHGGVQAFLPPVAATRRPRRR